MPKVPPVSPPFPPAAYGPPLPPLPPLAALQPRLPKETKAGVLFLLAAVRDGFMAFFVVVEGPLFLPWLLIPMTYTWILALFPLMGLVMAAWAARCAFRGTGRELIPFLGLAALVLSAFPGILVVGPLGLALTSGGLFAHRRFRRREGAFPRASPA